MRLRYVNFHQEKWISLTDLRNSLRELAGNVGAVSVDLDKLVEWLDKAAVPEET